MSLIWTPKTVEDPEPKTGDSLSSDTQVPCSHSSAGFTDLDDWQDPDDDIFTAFNSPI